jgi:hypothetical protein
LLVKASGRGGGASPRAKAYGKTDTRIRSNN